MPIYMDRHDVSEKVTAENVAHLHQEDLKIQHQFDCKGLTYWFDEDRKTAFCLVEAPDEQSVRNMHDHAHGEIPHRIIEVEPSIVESFLGRIEDPEKAQNAALNIINDPAFRTIMVLNIERIHFYKLKENDLKSGFHYLSKEISTLLNNYNGRIVKQLDDYFLVSFKSISKAIQCAVEVRSLFINFNSGELLKNFSLKIGLNGGVPVTDKKALFEDTIKLAERMLYVTKKEIVVTTELKDLYKSQNQNMSFDNQLIETLSVSEEKFLNQLMDYVESVWKDPDLRAEDFGKEIGYSKSQLYRKMVALTAKSPNTFIKDYRLNKALSMILKQQGTISEITFESGFGSPAYFSKCFNKKYKVSPSACLEKR